MPGNTAYDNDGVTDWPAWATEPVRVLPPDEAWLVRGERQCRRLDTVLAAYLLAPVEHVGSTAVPGLPAKPILDLQAAVADLGHAGDVAALLGRDGWHYVPPELDNRPWRRFLVKVEGGHRVAHLHLLRLGHPRWHQQLVFRDALRNDLALLRQYAALKASLAAEHAEDREAYTEGKAEFVAAVMRELTPEQARPSIVEPVDIIPAARWPAHRAADGNPAGAL